MTSAPGYALDLGPLALVALLCLAAVTAVVLVVRDLAPRRGWTADAAAALTWSTSTAVVAVLSLGFIALWDPPRVDYGWTAYTPNSPSASPNWFMAWSDQEVLATGVTTLVWLPCVMALLWSVLHVLRSGTGHHSPLLGVPVGLAIPALWLVSTPLLVTVFTVGVLGVLSWVGLVVWLAGQALVATGRSWLGDVAVWTGVALVAADAWPGYVGLVSPLVVAALVLFQRSRGSVAPGPVAPS